MVTRRLMFPRVLELAEDAILFPRGFPRTRITSIPYADIIRITDSWEHRQAGLSVVTARGDFEITASYLPDIQSYHAARKFIYSQASIVMPPHDQREPSAGTTWGQFPEPILRWVEPEDWPRYRTRLVVSKPLWLRLAKSLWFFVRCFSIFFTPWLLLHFLGGVKPEPAYFCASIFVTLFITYFYH